MRIKLLLLLTVVMVLLCFAVPAVAQADGILVYNGEQTAGSPETRSFSDFAAAVGQPVTYLDTPMPAGYDLSGFDCVILSGFFPVAPDTFLPQTKALLQGYVTGGGRLLALAEGAVYSSNIAGMNDLAAFVGSDLSVVPANLDPDDYVTTNIDPSPFTAGVSQVGGNYSSEVAVVVSGSAHSMVRSTGGTTILGADQVGAGWFFLSGDSNIFNDVSRLLWGIDIYALYDNDVLAWNICNALAAALDLKTAALAALEDLFPLNPLAAPYVQRAIDYLYSSTNPTYWADDNHLMEAVGRQVFVWERYAVENLRTAMNYMMQPKKGVAQGVINLLVSADRTLAEVAIADAQAAGGNAAYINSALRYLALGDAYAPAPPYYQPGLAIYQYGLAWWYAVKAY